MVHYLTAEVSRAAVAHNLRAIRDRIGNDCALCAVVKADAYGHHLAGIWDTIAEADWMAVATIGEAIALRDMGFGGPILTTIACATQAGGEQLHAATEAIEADVQLTVTHAADVGALQRQCEKVKRPVTVHVKIDTGMGRSGVLPAEAPALIDEVRSSPMVHLAGVYTHFADSDDQDKAHAEQQFGVFCRTLATLGDLDGVVRHAANSAAIADLPHTRLDMVRAGLAVYGYQSSDHLLHPMDLRPALRLTGPLMQVKRLPEGSTCGYGRMCKLHRDSRVGIIPAGYADGIPRNLSNRCPTAVGSALLPVLGPISMDQIIVDLTDAPQVKVGARVELISPNPVAANSVANLARLAETIPYEITSRLGKRIDYKVVDDFAPSTD